MAGQVAVLLWALETTTQEDREVKEILDKQSPALENLHQCLSWYLDTLNHASKYPYGYEALTFQITKDRKRLRGYEGLQTFLPQKEWMQISRAFALNRIIFMLYVEKTDLERRSFKIEKKSIARIRTLLEKRKLKLRCDLDSGKEGLVSWEPLHVLLAQ